MTKLEQARKKINETEIGIKNILIIIKPVVANIISNILFI